MLPRASFPKSQSSMWRQIRSNRRRSLFVVLGMVVLLLGTGAGVGAVAAGEAGLVYGAAAGALLWLILWRVAVSGGDDLMLSIARAKEVPDNSMQQLRNVLEEMSIAAALAQTPRLFVIDDPSPNAFATGRRPEKSAVAVTTGLLATLDRDELQGVIAHELAHIRNQDVRLMVLAGVMLGSIVMLADVGRNLLWFGGGRRSRSSNNGGGGAVIAVLAIVVMVIGPVLAQLFYFSLSRRREYLADASAAAFTRYPDGLASALEKIGGAPQRMRSRSRVTAPMYISAPGASAARGRRGRGSAWSTHPPIHERVQILRSMGGGAGLVDYQLAYSKVHGGDLMPDHAAASDPLASAPLRAAVATGARSAVDSAGERRTQVRAASDALLQAEGYRWKACASCGAVSKLPPQLAGTVRRCVRCETAYSSS